MARRRLLPSLLLLGLAQLHDAHAATTAFGNKPVQLLAPTDAARTALKPVEEGLRALESLQGPVGVVSIVGPYHSGKSFMLNQLVRSLAPYTVAGDPEPGNVFEVGRSVDPQTAGVWAFHRRVKLPAIHPEPMDLLLLDTEGFAVANVSEAYDARIFAASTVLSSLLLYNSMHLIDAKELEALDLLAHNTQLFTLKAVNDNTDSPDDDAATVAANVTAAFELRDVFQLPPLLWAVQAFTLDLKEESCTSWLHRMLEGATVANANAAVEGVRGNQVPEQRLGLSKLFPSIACETLFLPATARSALHDLGAVDPTTGLTPEFKADVASVRDAILASLQPKMQGGRPLTGAGLAALVRLVVDGLNRGQLYQIPSRWASFSDHLRVSSVRGAVSHFEAEVGHGFRNVTPPLPAPTMAQLVRRVKKQATELVPRLLVGLEKQAVRQAGKDVEAHLRELAYKLTGENEALVREHLKATRELLVAEDEANVQAFLATELPMTTPGLKAWATLREEALAQTFLSGQADYKDEPRYAGEARDLAAGGHAPNNKEQDAHTVDTEGGLTTAEDAGFAPAAAADEPRYAGEARDLAAAARAQSDKARAANAVAMEGVLKAAEAACVQQYQAGMEEGLPAEAPVLEAVIDGLHKPALANATACLGTHAPAFVGETAFRTRLGSLVKAVTEHQRALLARNSARLNARCEAARTALMANATLLVKPTHKSTDEAALEGVLRRVAAVRATFEEAVAPLGATPECKNHDRLLGEETAALADGARHRVAANLKAALSVPLQEICKLVLEGNCHRIRSVRKLRSTVEGECGKWVRRSEPLGATLSPSMVKRVLGLFIDTDLAPCKAQVMEREKEAKRRWARMALTGLAAFVVPLLLMLLTAGVKIETVEVEEPVSSSVSGDGSEQEHGPTGTPVRTTTVRRRRLSIGGGRLSIGAGRVSFGGGGGGMGTPVTAAAGARGSRRASLVNRIFSPMK